MSPMTGEDLLKKLQAMTPEERALYVVNESRSSNGDIVLNSNNVEPGWAEEGNEDWEFQDNGKDPNCLIIRSST